MAFLIAFVVLAVVVVGLVVGGIAVALTHRRWVAGPPEHRLRDE